MGKVEFICDIDPLIVMCHIIDNFEEFRNNVFKYIEINNNYDIILDLGAVINGKTFRGSKKLKKFYQENKNVIDEIQKYMHIGSFISVSCRDGLTECEHIDFGYIEKIYNYLMQNKGNIDKILAVLERLQKLGFTIIKYDEKLDFTKEEYCINSEKLDFNFYIKYVENIEVVPNYNTDKLTYKTQGSAYRIKIGYDFVSYFTKIELNSLIFDPDRLPRKIGMKLLYDELLELKESQRDIFAPIRHIVEIDINLNDLFNQYEKVVSAIEKEEDAIVKEKLRQELNVIKDAILRIQELNNNHANDIIESTNMPKEALPEPIQKVYKKLEN